MKYLILALINSTFGLIILLQLTHDTPGLILFVFIGSVISILGLAGLILWFWDFLGEIKGAPRKSSALKNWLQIAKGIDTLLVLGLIFRAFVLQPFVVDGNSMEPNYHNQEYLLVNMMTYRFYSPQRGDVIIFQSPKNPVEDYIKRIIALPEEKVEITNEEIYINGQILVEDYLPQDQITSIELSASPFQKILGKDEFFVMGDNRQHSSDSREWGPVPKKNIIGRAWLVVYPIQDAGLVKNPLAFKFASLIALVNPSLGP